jgi:RNA polymerase sigma-70 factor (ECF subfamily)
VTEGEDLIRRFRRGDEEAFRILFERYGRVLEARIRNLMPNRLRRKVAVSDVVQETALVAYSRRADFEERGEEVFRRWLLGIVENKVRETIRRHDRVAKRSARREVTRSDRADTAEFIGHRASPSQVAIAAELEALVGHALGQLPADYREVLRLSQHEHLTLREAAVRMGRSSDATKKLYGRAVARLRRTLLELRGETDD